MEVMRPSIFFLLAACGGGAGEGLEVEESTCNVGRLHYVHDLSLGGGVSGGEGDLSAPGHAFFNAGIRDANGNTMPGSLEIFGSTGQTVVVRIEFADLLAEGDTVDAHGYIKLVEQGVDAGNCLERTELSGRLADIGNGWKFTLLDLHASPYCSGAAFSGSFAGCVRSGN